MTRADRIFQPLADAVVGLIFRASGLDKNGRLTR